VTKTEQPLLPAFTAEDVTRPSTRYVDAVFLCLAIGAFVILGIQTLGAPTKSGSESEDTSVLATDVSLKAATDIELLSEVTPEPVTEIVPEPTPEPEPLLLAGEAADTHFGGRISLVYAAWRRSSGHDRRLPPCPAGGW